MESILRRKVLTFLLNIIIEDYKSELGEGPIIDLEERKNKAEELLRKLYE